MDTIFPSALNKGRATPAFGYLEDTVTGGWRSIRDSDLGTSSSKTYSAALASTWSVKSTAGILYAINGYNSGAGSGYIQVWDNTVSGANLVNVTKFTADSNIVIEYSDNGINMNTGITITASTTPLSFTAVSPASVLLSAIYK